MKFQPGDKVRFLDDVGGGIVKYLSGKEIAMVETEDGFEIPVNIKKLVKISETIEKEVKQRPQHAKPTAVKTEKSLPPVSDLPPSETLFLGVVPVTPFSVAVSDFYLYLINDTSWNIMFVMSEEQNDHLHLIASKILEPFTKFKITILTQSQISKAIFRVTVLPFKKEPYPYKSPVDDIIDLRQYAFYKQKLYEDNDFFQTPAFLIPICLLKVENAVEPDFREKDKVPPSTAEKKTPQFPDTEEVDLHIENLVENPGSLTPSEILNIQMARFTTALEGAILARQKRIIFIHGVGNGRLKYEIRKTLDEKYGHLRYQDASYQEYGFGATLVILRN
ncbi:MAG TPA: DUF2027 domain-containing protein [Bacteroidales bacterium]|nr:DUF2027 domain-containing protein [Bacteroidales bacterium]